MTEEVARSVSTARGRGVEYPPLGPNCAKKWLKLVEATLGIGKWFKKVSHQKDMIDTMTLGVQVDSPAQAAARRYLTLFKQVVNCQVGNGLCIVKYHHILHFCWYIERYGCIPNFDGSRPEGIAKTNTKDKFMLTQKQLLTENYQTACRLYESETVAVALNKINSRSSANPNLDRPTVEETNEEDDEIIAIPNLGILPGKSTATGSKFVITLTFEESSGIHEDEAQYKLDITWTRSKASLTLDQDIVESVVRRLFLHRGTGGCLIPNSKVIGFTEYKVNGDIFRCHPSYRSGKPWRDWAMLENVNPGNNDLVPCKIVILLDLCNSIVMTKQQHKRFCNNRDPALPQDEWSDALSQNSSDDEDSSALSNTVPALCLTNGLWCVVQTTTRQEIANDEWPSPHHFDSRISSRFKVSGSLCILPMESIKKPCFVINSSNRERSEYVFVVDDKSQWSQKTFLETNNS